MSSTVKTKTTKFPCPKCGKYYEPSIVTKGKSFMECKEHGIFEIDNKRSLNFRKFCSKLGSKPNRSQSYYTSTEERIKGYLDRRRLIEGIDYVHNCKIKNPNKQTYYWIDFLFHTRKIAIEVSPLIWHCMWGREKSELDKIKYLKSLGFKVVILKDKIMKRKYLKRIFDNLFKEEINK